MSDPLTSEGARLLGVGMISTFTLELLGIPAQPIMWAGIGSIFGMGLAQESGPVKRIFVYIGATLLSALIGGSIASMSLFTQYVGWGANSCSALVAVGFHPGLSWFLQNVPNLLGKLAGRITGGSTP